MVDLDKLSLSEFKQMPLVIEGESKEVRYAGKGLVVIRFKPTIYSFTHKRTGEVKGSEVLRLKASKILLSVFKEAGVRHSYHKINDRWVLSELVLQPETENNPKPFRPDDLTEYEIRKLATSAPIETIIKYAHTGTSQKRYYGMESWQVRESHPVYKSQLIRKNGRYPETLVRFDWRNPFMDENGNKLPDEVLPDSMADWFIDTRKARKTALKAFNALNKFLMEHKVRCYDLCLIIAEDGETVFGEVSQDCGRFRHAQLGSLDKDVWRSGGSEEAVLQKWQTLLDEISK